jgi:hypothetical protein
MFIYKASHGLMPLEHGSTTSTSRRSRFVLVQTVSNRWNSDALRPTAVGPGSLRWGRDAAYSLAMKMPQPRVRGLRAIHAENLMVANLGELNCY